MLYGNRKKSYSIFTRMKKMLRNQIMVYRLIDLAGDFFWKVLLLKYRFSTYGFKRAIFGRFTQIREDRNGFIIKWMLFGIGM